MNVFPDRVVPVTCQLCQMPTYSLMVFPVMVVPDSDGVAGGGIGFTSRAMAVVWGAPLTRPQLFPLRVFR